jgi:hypothetical protein
VPVAEGVCRGGVAGGNDADADADTDTDADADTDTDANTDADTDTDTDTDADARRGAGCGVVGRVRGGARACAVARVARVGRRGGGRDRSRATPSQSLGSSALIASACGDVRDSKAVGRASLIG